MKHSATYDSPLGKIYLQADEVGLSDLWIDGQRTSCDFKCDGGAASILEDAKRWLDIYFDGREPKFDIPLHLSGSEFQIAVWEILQTVPYGQTTTYGAVAAQLENKFGRKMSAQAVGGAVGRNPISIIVPCHRVIGANGNLTGYAGGLDKKIFLLKLENAL